MKIATWNLERPKTRSRKNPLLLEKLKDENADIFILTETNSCIDLGSDYVDFPSKEADSSDRWAYTPGENRVTIWAKRTLSTTRKVETRDPASCVCIGLQTERGELLVYGTVIGALGRPTEDDLKRQIEDWEKLGESPNMLCIAGDFNTSFVDRYHFTHSARDGISTCFKKLNIANLTGGERECIDHIAISRSFFGSSQPKIHEWNLGKKTAIPRLSDHKGICVEFHFPDNS